MTGIHHEIKLYLVGCGGTGSWLASHLVRLGRFLNETRQLMVSLTCVDPDDVESKNVLRQNFCEAEVGGHKAELLALRYSAAWGQRITVHPTRFEKEIVQLDHGDLGVIVGCVDNAAARRTIAEALNQDAKRRSDESAPRLWWLDAGNGRDTGQVLFGAARTAQELRYAFPYYPQNGFCVNLPAPDLQHPDLLEDQAAPEVQTDDRKAPSCAELALMGEQSPAINSVIAGIAASYLWRLFADPKGLTTFATYCNLSVLSKRSRFITPDNVAQAVRKSIKLFKPQHAE
jgi:PRTRC genetic system ThiF family protein